MKSWQKYALLVLVINVLTISYLVSDVMSMASIRGSSGYWLVIWFLTTWVALITLVAVNILSLNRVFEWAKDSGKLHVLKEKLSVEVSRIRNWLDKDGL